MVSEPPSSMLRAAPKKRFGRCRALASTPPVSTLPEAGTTVLYARARRVMESSRMTTSFLCSTRRLAFSSTISATCTWRVAGSSKVEATTSPFTERVISVTSSGRSSINSTISTTSGWLEVMACAMCCIMTVLPLFGLATSRPRWPLPIGAIMSMTRPVMFSSPLMSRSRMSGSVGKRGVRFSNRILCLVFSGSSPLTLSTLTRAK